LLGYLFDIAADSYTGDQLDHTPNLAHTVMNPDVGTTYVDAALSEHASGGF
jgi:hypothetical protein